MKNRLNKEVEDAEKRFREVLLKKTKAEQREWPVLLVLAAELAKPERYPLVRNIMEDMSWQVDDEEYLRLSEPRTQGIWINVAIYQDGTMKITGAEIMEKK